jgi:radical SAM superfamily enzyme YgiQ (UPF0313 family)
MVFAVHKRKDSIVIAKPSRDRINVPMQPSQHEFSVFLLMAPCRRLQFNLSGMYAVPRLGIGYLSATLKANGYHRVECRDIMAEHEWIPDLLQRFRSRGAPDLLGISVTILSLREAFEIAAAVKAEFRATRVVVGGPGVGFRAEGLLKYGAAVDFFVRGEGEAAMLALVNALASGGDLAAVPALIWRDAEGRARENPPGKYRDLNDGITVDYAAQPMDRYRLHPPMGVYPPATMMETTRGCSYPCNFCCLSMPVRYRDPARIEDELRALMATYRIREVHFIDPTFTLNRSRTLELVDRLSRLGLRWTCKTRVDHLDEELVARMAQAGCYLIAFGVESGHDAILGNVAKKAVSETALTTFALCRRYRIRTTAYLMVGNPGETDETVRHTIRFVRQLQPDYVLYDILMPDPINHLTQQQIAAGKFGIDDLERYYMADQPTRLHEITVAGHDIGQAHDWLKRSSTDFYVRPRYFAQRIRDLRTIQDAKNLGAGGWAFARELFRLNRLWRWRSPA